jgi:malate dehydrogenase (oxaloacetate-decarboxylating)
MNTQPTVEERLAQAARPADQALRLHRRYRGKMQTLPKCAIRGLEDFAIWYSPGVAAPCLEIAKHPDAVHEYTNKGNTVAIVSDGSRVLGLGNIGPTAALPVIEGKALLFKYLGGVDAVPICLSTQDPDELIGIIAALEPAFGGINLEDLAHPKCFRVLDALRARLSIPVWHDDQQGTAVVVLAALINALAVLGKSLPAVRIALLGAGAAGVAVYRLLETAGADAARIVVCDSRGTLHRGRVDIERTALAFADKWRMCTESNAAGVTGGIDAALCGADVCIAFTKPDPATIRPEWVRAMAPDAIVFACANPVPEIWPWDAAAAGARVVATGRSDFPNQVNNALAFPSIFRGVLDVRARAITAAMAIAAAREIAAFAAERDLSPTRIVPRMDEWDVFPRVAAATAMQAQSDGVAHRRIARDDLMAQAERTIRIARESTDALLRAGCIEAAA